MLPGLFARIPLSGIRGKTPFLCVLCDSAVIVSKCLQTEQIYDNHYRSRKGRQAQGWPVSGRHSGYQRIPPQVRNCLCQNIRQSPAWSRKPNTWITSTGSHWKTT